MPPVKPMLAKATNELPAGADLLYEPKWDGFRCLVFRDGDEIELFSRNERPLARYFPELIDPLCENLPERCVIDGEVVVATAAGLDFDALQQRIHPAESRINRLAAQTPASYVAFDILALGEDDLRRRSFSERRATLQGELGGACPPVHLTPATADREVASDWFDRFEGAGFDGVMAKPTDAPYVEDKRTQIKVKHKRTVDCVVAGYRVHKSGDGVGSLLLGLYDDAGVLHHVGVCTSFSAARRSELLAEIAPYRADALAEHPWREWADHAAHMAAEGRMPGAPSRWNSGKDQGWEPLRPELVVEVAYEGMQGMRFRHQSRFVRWRPDRSPESCTYAQTERLAPVELREVFT
ncbi:MAG: DNA ligase C [Acidimicrobiales bacterium]|nr:MAG: ATP-dependent DNA ligase [Actinomycetota bacterium]MBV6507349.1 DNA ligase C [Acidimicrobiales bacterium]RIK04512.1 MAG: ATP-dependent DNA ligase [Acidobacteriota bacterium]